MALKLLRCGATLLVTSRFPADAARRFAAEEDFELWQGRLHCFGLDLRQAEAIESLCAHVLSTFGRLDIVRRSLQCLPVALCTSRLRPSVSSMVLQPTLG